MRAWNDSWAMMIVAAAALLSSACGKAVRAANEASHDAGIGGGNGAGGSGACALATDEELAQTPRANRNLEQLALALSHAVVAEQTIYDRVVRDVTALRALAPEVAAIDYFPSDTGGLLLQPDAKTYTSMQQGSYTAWDCLNHAYAMTASDFIAFGSLYEVTLHTPKVLNAMRVAAQYARLSGVSRAAPDLVGGDGPTICVTTTSTTWHYVFDAAGGDCPSGCTTDVYYYFTTEPDGSIARVGSWDAQSGSAQPGWVSVYASDSVCHPGW